MSYTKKAKAFIENIYREALDIDIDINSYVIDHLCYRTDSQDHYLQTKKDFQACSTLLIESIVGGRYIATYKLNRPIEFLDQNISVIEIPSPKDGSDYTQGFEHIELVIKDSFEVFMGKYPTLNFKTNAINKEINPDIKINLKSGSIKFHHQSLEDIINWEKANL